MEALLSAEQRRTKYSVPAVEKALDILEHLAEEAVPMRQAQLARACRRQPGELFRMLTCLEGRGYLRRDPATGAYALTLKLFELSRTHSPHDELLRAAVPLMQGLAEEIRESCHLSVLHRDRLLVLAQAESPQPFRLSVEVGSLHSPVATTSGRVLLAAMQPAELDSFLARQPEFTERTAEERGILHQRLAAIRECGHELSDGERFVGGLDLGVLVGSSRSRVKAVLTIATLKTADGPDLAQALPMLKARAVVIAEQAGLTREVTP